MKKLDKYFRLFFLVLGGLIGLSFVRNGVPVIFRDGNSWQMASVAVSRETLVLAIVIGAVIGGIGSPFFVRWVKGLITIILSYLHKLPASDIFIGSIGMVFGLLIAMLLAMPFRSIPMIGEYFPPIITLLFGYVSTVLFVRKKEELLGLFDFTSPQKADSQTRGNSEDNAVRVTPKILDTSVIIDGRILDICQTGFLEGDLLVPGFVLEEIQHIADSADLLRRNRGRRGLDILNKMQKELLVEVRIVQRDYPDIAEVDSRIVQLAKDMKGKVLTNDFNLNKVCELQGVEVLNINELANAVKPIVLPGEEMAVQVIKDGKEVGQGVAYLDDGTMIVVDGGRRHIGETIEVMVTSVLQTAAGRMIFAKPKANEKAIEA